MDAENTPAEMVELERRKERAPQPVPGGDLRERLAWGALDYEIAPTANRIPYMLGGLTFFGIVLLFATGLFLAQFYDSSPLGAHDSTVYIVTRVPLGYWIRGLHYWASAVVLVSVTGHVVWVFSRRSYRKPRELTWWSGVAMLALLFALVFTGTVLRSDQEGGEALAHAVAGAQLVGPMGAPLTPGFAPSTTLLARLYTAHVSLLPLALVGLLGLHFWLIRYLGIHADEPRTRRFPQHLLRLTGLALLLYAGIAALGALFPPGIGFPAIEGVEVTKPYWPFLWIYAAENAMGLWGMIVSPAALFAFLVAVPVLDRGGSRRARWLSTLAAVVLAALLGALAYGALAPKVQHLGM
jgi:quinol-cytochrome oxidoreductase complex cytochrome b subunit